MFQRGLCVMYLHEIETNLLSLIFLIQAPFELFLRDELTAVFSHEFVLHNENYVNTFRKSTSFMASFVFRPQPRRSFVLYTSKATCSDFLKR